MKGATKYIVIGILGLIAPLVFANFQVQLSFLWLMILFALTWDTQGGQMGYNSFGNVLFFGIGMYVCAVVQVGLVYDVAQYTASAGLNSGKLNGEQYLTGLALGMGVAAVVGVALAALIGSGILGLRGHYFAIGTLGLGIAFGELFAGWDYVGAGSGLAPPPFPDELDYLGGQNLFFYYIFFALAVAAFFSLKMIYSSRFGLAINAIRDDEDKAEAMGLRTVRYKTVSWCVSAFFLALAGGPLGMLVGFIDPRETAFAGVTFGIWMVLMAILGGKGTIWGPVIGATIFHVTQELFWTFLLGWQRVAMGVLIVVIVVFFPRGIMGFLRDTWPDRFGETVDEEGAAS